MKYSRTLLLPALFSAAAAQAVDLSAIEFSGNVGAEWREFIEKGQWSNSDVDQARHQFSISAEPEFAWESESGDHVVVFKAFGRYDSEDDERSHGDIREASWLTYGDDWELKAGISKVYWGVTESQHLVDIVNQTDFVEAPDGEDKLGQPMVKLSLVRDWGLVDAFILPGFRERTFPGEDGRFRPQLVVKDAEYQDDDKDKHIDYALRWSHTIDDYDIGLSYFNGTSRDPLLKPSGFNGPQPTEFSAFYAQINQFGLDFQATLDSWLWKLETIYRTFDESVKDSFRSQKLEDYSAATGGFEYTFYGIAETDWDLGALMEYQYDSRDQANISLTQNDLFVGGRLAMNDADSTEILFGMTQDLDHSSTRSMLLEAETRLGDSVKLNVEGLLFSSDDEDNLSYQFRRDDYIQVSLYYYY